MAGEDLLPDSINEVQPSTDGANPWMLGKPSSEAKDSGTQEDPKDLRESAAPEDAGNEGEEMSEDEILLQDFEQRRCTRQQQTGSPEPEGEQAGARCHGPGAPLWAALWGLEWWENRSQVWSLLPPAVRSWLGWKRGCVNPLPPCCSEGSSISPISPMVPPRPPWGLLYPQWVAVPSPSALAGAGEAEEAHLFAELLSNVQTGPGVEQPAQGPEGPLLSEQLGRRRTPEEIDALGQEEGAEEQERPWPTGTLQESEEEGSAGGCRTARKAPKQKMINLQAVLAGESHVIQCPAQPISVQDEVSWAPCCLLH